MASYWVKIQVSGSNIKSVRKKMEKVFPGEAFSVDKINPNRSRAERLSEAESSVEDAKSTVEELKEEIESWIGNLPENLEGGNKASELEECQQALEEIVDGLEQIDFSSVNFPGMM